MSVIPEWSKPRAIFLLALAATLVAAAKLLIHIGPTISVSLGDSDDAMRLVMVRDLIAGRGWFDQHLMRLQPPFGVYMHWSRLLDGAIGGYDLSLRTIASPATAEWLTRLTWPLLWLFPAIAAGLVLTRRLGGAVALIAGALLFTICADSYGQFAPGRIDHHNVQIALCVIAAAGAVCSGESRLAAIAAGVATALGLAIGIEALVFYVTIGAALALRFVADPARRGALTAYGLALAPTSLAAFVAQTPPQRWGVPACDALGDNLVAALVVAGLAVAAAAFAARNAGPALRAAAVAAAGLAAAAVYLSLDPSCRTGPMAAVDPSIRTIWFDKVDEIQPLGVIAAKDFARAASMAAPALLGLAACAWLGRKRENRTFAWALTGACLVVAVASMVTASRMSSYLTWFALPFVATVLTGLAMTYGRRLLVSVIGLAALFAPPTVCFAVTSAYALTRSHAAAPSVAPAWAAGCLRTAAYARLAGLPPGLVLAHPDFGPFILANTGHSVLSAPYHRAPWGIRTSIALLDAPPDPNGNRLRALGVSYVVVCAPLRFTGPGLDARLEARTPPGWLQPLSKPGETLQIYRVG